jgi:hypothetical protein
MPPLPPRPALAGVPPVAGMPPAPPSSSSVTGVTVQASTRPSVALTLSTVRVLSAHRNPRWRESLREESWREGWREEDMVVLRL